MPPAERALLGLCQSAGKADDPPPRIFEARLGSGQRDAQVTDGTRPKAVAGQECNVLAEQQFARKTLGAEPASAYVEQYEHAALGRDGAAIRSILENVCQHQGATAIGFALSRNLGKLAAECGQCAILYKGRAAEIHAQQKIKEVPRQ